MLTRISFSLIIEGDDEINVLIVARIEAHGRWTDLCGNRVVI